MQNQTENPTLGQPETENAPMQDAKPPQITPHSSTQPELNGEQQQQQQEQGSSLEDIKEKMYQECVETTDQRIREVERRREAYERHKKQGFKPITDLDGSKMNQDLVRLAEPNQTAFLYLACHQSQNPQSDDPRIVFLYFGRDKEDCKTWFREHQKTYDQYGSVHLTYLLKGRVLTVRMSDQSNDEYQENVSRQVLSEYYDIRRNQFFEFKERYDRFCLENGVTKEGELEEDGEEKKAGDQGDETSPTLNETTTTTTTTTSQPIPPPPVGANPHEAFPSQKGGGMTGRAAAVPNDFKIGPTKVPKKISSRLKALEGKSVVGQKKSRLGPTAAPKQMPRISDKVKALGQEWVVWLREKDERPRVKDGLKAPEPWFMVLRCFHNPEDAEKWMEEVASSVVVNHHIYLSPMYIPLPIQDVDPSKIGKTMYREEELGVLIRGFEENQKRIEKYRAECRNAGIEPKEIDVLPPSLSNTLPLGVPPKQNLLSSPHPNESENSADDSTPQQQWCAKGELTQTDLDAIHSVGSKLRVQAADQKEKTPSPTTNQPSSSTTNLSVDDPFVQFKNSCRDANANQMNIQPISKAEFQAEYERNLKEGIQMK